MLNRLSLTHRWTQTCYSTQNLYNSHHHTKWCFRNTRPEKILCVLFSKEVRPEGVKESPTGKEASRGKTWGKETLTMRDKSYRLTRGCSWRTVDDGVMMIVKTKNCSVDDVIGIFKHTHKRSTQSVLRGASQANLRGKEEQGFLT